MGAAFEIGGLPVGAGHPCFVVAEIGQAHDGSLGTAHAYIDAVAKTGVQAIKFQTHLAQAESTPDEPFRSRGFPQDATRQDYWRRMEFTPAQWKDLKAHAEDRNLQFLSSPFSMEAVALLREVGVPAWKVGSGETGNLPLLEYLGGLGQPVLLSTGMSSWQEIDAAVSVIRAQGGEVGVFQCTTAYPCPPERIGLNILAALRTRYDCPVGLSDHSGTIYPALAAVALGVHLIEVHTVFSRECFGPDTVASVTTAELKQLVEGVRMLETALGAPVDKDMQALQLEPLRRMFSKSLYVARNLPQGHRLAAGDLCLKKPGNGMPPSRLVQVMGKGLRRAYRVDELLEESDLEG